MKKIVSGLIAVLMMAAALVAFSGTAANAVCPYGGCTPTYTVIHAPNKVKAGHRARICVNVRPADGSNGTPKGHVTLRVVKFNAKDRYVATKYYGGGKTCFHTTKLHRGRYSVKAIYNRKPGSRWQDSDQATSLRVVKNRHHR